METILYALMMGLVTPTYADSDTKEIIPDGLNAAVASAFADMNQPGHPGCSVGIQQNGQVIFTGGYGYTDIENQVLITPNTHFNIASIGGFRCLYTAISAKGWENNSIFYQAPAGANLLVS